MKRGFITAVVLAALLCFSQVAQATFSTDHEYMVMFQQGITWHGTAAEGAGWGDSFHLAAISSLGEERYLQSLLNGLPGGFQTGGYQDSSDRPRWTTGDPWGYAHQANRAFYDYFGPGSRTRLAVWSEQGSDPGRRDWRWNGEKWSDWRWSYKAAPIYISVIIVESSDPQVPTTATPVPPAVWLLGSGLVMIVGARVSWQNRRG